MTLTLDWFDVFLLVTSLICALGIAFERGKRSQMAFTRQLLAQSHLAQNIQFAEFKQKWHWLLSAEEREYRQ